MEIKHVAYGLRAASSETERLFQPMSKEVGVLWES